MTYIEIINLLQGPKKEILDDRDIDFLMSIKGIYSLILRGEYDFAVGSINQYFIVNSNEINDCKNIMNDVFCALDSNMRYSDLYAFAIDALLHDAYAISCGVLEILLYKLKSRHYLNNSEELKIVRCDNMIGEIIDQYRNQLNYYCRTRSDKGNVQNSKDFNEDNKENIGLGIVFFILFTIVWFGLLIGLASIFIQ